MVSSFYNIIGFYLPCGQNFGAFKYIGIDMASQLNIRNIIFEMDSLIVVNLVTSGSSQNSFLQPLLNEVTSLIHHTG